MNHQPFEEWLLNDKNLTPSETRELDLHLRTCVHCTALSATGLALRSANMIAPAAGFTLRFQQRLAAQKIAERIIKGVLSAEIAYEGQVLPIGISAGIVTALQIHASTEVQPLIDQARQARARARENGGNQVFLTFQ